MAACDAKYGFFNLVNQSATDITASSENAFFPASNLKDSRTTKVYRSETGTTSANVVFDFKTVEDVDMIAFKPDFENGFGHIGDLTIEANIIDSWGSPAYSTTLTVNTSRNLGLKILDIAQSYRFWRVSGTGSNYFELANLFIGGSFTPGRNIQFNWNYSNVDLSKSRRNADGQTFIDTYSFQQNIDFNLRTLQESEDHMSDLQDQLDSVGTRTPIWFVADPTAVFSPDKEFFAGQYYITRSNKVTNVAFSIYDTSLTLREVK